MNKLPKKVYEALEKLRRESPPPPYIVVRRIQGRYYAYKDVVSFDAEKKRRHNTSEYLGKITEEGAFIKRALSKDDELDNAEAVILSRGGKVFFPGKTEAGEQKEAFTPDEITSKILTILSMNGRAGLPFISERTHLSISAVDSRVRKLEKNLGIRYTIEPDLIKLGYLSYVVFVKFRKEKPTERILRDVITKEPKIQLAVLTKGEYDLVLYVLERGNDELTIFMAEFGNTSALRMYRAEWYASPNRLTYNFIPLRDEFFEELKSNVWVRSKETPRPLSWNLLERELIVLRELNKNASVGFGDIDLKYGFHAGTSAYTYHKLIERGIIKRVTINMESLAVRYFAFIQIKIISGAEFAKTRPALLLDIIRYLPNGFSKYALVGDIDMPRGALLAAPVFKESGLQELTEALAAEVGGIEVGAMVVTGFITGTLCSRRFDNEYSLQYKTLRDRFKLQGFRNEREFTVYQQQPVGAKSAALE